MTEKEMIEKVLFIFPNMTLGEDNSGQLIIYTDTEIVGGDVVPFNERNGF